VFESGGVARVAGPKAVGRLEGGERGVQEGWWVDEVCREEEMGDDIFGAMLEIKVGVEV
jgi:hypothetical protein